MTNYNVRLPSWLKPMIEAVAKEEYRTPSNVVQMLVERALAQRAMERGKQQRS